MDDTYVYVSLVALCSLILLSYIYSVVSKKIRVPSILLLLATGLILGATLKLGDNYVAIPQELIQFVGVIGLILILLEAGLELEFSKEKAGVIKKAASSSLLVLTLSVLAKALVIFAILDVSWISAVVFAVPLSIVSSAVVTSSFHILSRKKREFLKYETAISDTAGILLFEYLIGNDTFGLGSAFTSIFAVLLAVIASIMFSVLLIWLAARIRTLVKSFVMLAFLLLIYSAGHLLHLPSHLMVVIFALSISNWDKVRSLAPVGKTLDIGVRQLSGTLKTVTAEAAFLIRTFFFTLFGYSINAADLIIPDVIYAGVFMLLVIYVIRFLYLKIFAEEYIIPELFFAPRGLVTVLLFYHIPENLQIARTGDEIVFLVIVSTSVVMMISNHFIPHYATGAANREGKPEDPVALG